MATLLQHPTRNCTLNTKLSPYTNFSYDNETNMIIYSTD